jgi:hypothetical protein
MTSRKPATFIALGAVLGILVATLVAVLVWPDGDADDRAEPAANRGAESSSSSGDDDAGLGDVAGEPAPEVPARDAVDLFDLDLSAANRRGAVAGLPDWSHAGYRGGQPLPSDGDFTDDEACLITADELSRDYEVVPDDGKDDGEGIQGAVDRVRDVCSPQATYDRLSRIELPQGVLDVSREISVDADYLVIRGAGSDPATGTRIVFRPDDTTAYDALTGDGSDWDEDGMTHEDGKGGWLWPGRGLFRVQSREVDEDYREAYASAPDNRRDIFEGTVNVHWKAGVELREAPGEDGFAAREGDDVVYLDDGADLDDLTEGGWVNIRAANSLEFYEQQSARPTDFELQNLHMRQQIFGIAAIDEDEHTVTVDKPLEFDVPVDSTSDGSDEIEGKTYASKASPLVDPVVGVGFEGFHFGQVIPDGDPAAAEHEYGNLAPAYEMHGIVFKWAVDSWVRGTASYMTGSHPIVTEEAKNLQIEGNYFDGAWNKGKGGNGYLRGSRVWDSLYAGNVLRGLRHATFQWSASGNVFIGNDTDSDLNLHGGWERNNLFERNTVRVPYEHRPGSCTANCGGEGGSGDEADDATWYPIWWGAGQKAVKWSGATGPRNVFYGNRLEKQTAEGGPFAPYAPYDSPTTVYAFGWNGTFYQHLSAGGTPIDDWAGHETDDFTGSGAGVATFTDPGPSLFLQR